MATTAGDGKDPKPAASGGDKPEEQPKVEVPTVPPTGPVEQQPKEPQQSGDDKRPQPGDTDTVTLVYRGPSGRLVDETSGSVFLRDGDPVTVDAEVWDRIKAAVPNENFDVDTEE